MKLSSSRSRHIGVVVLEKRAQDVRQLDDQLAGLLGAKADERSNGVEGVEEKVRVDLALQSVETRFEQQAFLLFEASFGADGVPDLERDADHHRRAGPGGQPD